ncbi:MAG: sugar phosphate isomerase/epimerase [Verrucomicrobiaceae bacterium]|nr:sugar phosphate isomerase/epimerase [Verrucomicrobiaceae bacterium]
MTSLPRREFLRRSALLAAGAAFPVARQVTAAPDAPDALAGRLYKTLKIGMVKNVPTLTEKFKIAKEAGFHGIEMNAPGLDIEETKKAIVESGLPVDGAVCASHWRIRHTSADDATRAQALHDLKNGLRQTRAIGGHSLLLVVGKGEDGPENEIWERSIENISKAIPVAAEEGVTIVIENVWNQFLYDHEGGHDQTADKFVKYVDEFRSPWVGMHFDIGNHWKYGSMGDWIRQLGKRIYKLDVKGFSRAESKFTAIGEGDLDFADVRKALNEINYYGWCAAEVAGGGLEELKIVSDQMDKVFGL